MPPMQEQLAVNPPTEIDPLYKGYAQSACRDNFLTSLPEYDLSQSEYSPAS